MTELESSAVQAPRRERTRAPWWQLMFQVVSRPQFLIGALVPVLIFYGLQRAGQPLAGAVLAGIWGLGAALAGYLREHRWNVFGVLAAILSAITVITTLIARDVTFYLASDAVGDVLSGTVFLASLLLPRSLMQIIVEETGIGRFPEIFRITPIYRRAWRIVTLVWGGAYLLKAALLLFAQFGLLNASLMSLETFLSVRVLSGWAAAAGATLFAFWFPGWYWGRER